MTLRQYLANGKGGKQCLIVQAIPSWAWMLNKYFFIEIQLLRCLNDQLQNWEPSLSTVLVERWERKIVMGNCDQRDSVFRMLEDLNGET